MKTLMLHSPSMELRDQDGMLNLFKVNKHRLQKVIILDLLPSKRLEWIALSIDGKPYKMLVAVDHRQLTQEELLYQITGLSHLFLERRVTQVEVVVVRMLIYHQVWDLILENMLKWLEIDLNQHQIWNHPVQIESKVCLLVNLHKWH